MLARFRELRKPFSMPRYSENAVLYRHRYKDESGSFVLVGNDPADPDVGKLFRWLDESGGWEKRELWAHGLADLLQLAHPAGLRSGWPGAIPLPPRQPGRPRKDVPVDDQIVKVSASLRRAELFEVMRLAADAHQSVAEWVAETLRARIRETDPNSSTEASS